MRHWILGFGLVVSSLAFTACNSGCDDATIHRAVAFLDAHQSCDTDADCVVVSDQCEELPGGWCGQLTMNRKGSESGEWKTIEAELDDCAPDECTVCGGALVPSCHDGSCR